MEIFCPTCGKSSKSARFVGQFCEECTANRLRETVGNSASITMCKSCGRMKSRLGYQKMDDNALSVTVKSQLKANKYNVDLLESQGDSAKFIFTKEIDGINVSFEKDIRIKTLYEMCPRCSRKSAGYYEALIQMRGDPDTIKKRTEQLEEFISNHGAFISKVVEIPQGCDIYVSDKTLVSLFFKKRRLTPTRSYTLYGMRNGKKLYRNIYSISFGT